MGKTMSKTRIQLSGVLAVLAATAVATPALAQSIFYDNSLPAHSLGEFKSMGSLQFGDRIQMDLAPGLYPLTDFYFEYYAQPLAAGGGQQAIFRIYANDGPVTAASGDQSTPGSLLFENTWLSQAINLRSGWRTVEIHGNGQTITVPDSFTWTVQFTGLQQGDVVGLPIYGDGSGGVDVGSSGEDFWVYENGEWASYSLTSGTAANFAARAVAIPEPSILQLVLLGGAGWLGLLAFRRRS